MKEFPAKPSHELFQQKLMDYLYQETPVQERTNFEAHLKGCAECRDDLQEFRNVREALGEWELDACPQIALAIPPSLSRSFRQLFRAMPVWMRAASLAAAAMLLLAIVNFRISLGGPAGFQIQAGLRPPTMAPSQPTPSTGISEEKVQALVETAVQREQDRHRTEMTALLADLEGRLRTDRRSELIQFAETIRREQGHQIESVRREMDRRSRPTFASLFLDSDAGTGN